MIGPIKRLSLFLYGDLKKYKNEKILQEGNFEEKMIINSEEKEKIENDDESERFTFKTIYECFSLDKNFDKFLQIPNKSPLSFMNGIRTLSFLWVLLGHEFQNRIFLLTNFYSAKKVLSSSSLLLIGGGFFVVDVFFWMSGFLFSYTLLDPKMLK